MSGTYRGRVSPNERFGRWTVVRLSAYSRRGREYWDCVCDCGTTRPVCGFDLVKQTSKGCGCRRNEVSADLKRTHGRSGTAYYQVWREMKNRCSNPSVPSFADYGGRGIKVCERWQKFENFLADMGERPKGALIDRINNDGDYEPANCRWATRVESANNTRGNRPVEFNGERLTVAQWSRKIGLRQSTLWSRLFRYHWPVEKALVTPRHRPRD